MQKVRFRQRVSIHIFNVNKSAFLSNQTPKTFTYFYKEAIQEEHCKTVKSPTIQNKENL